MISIDVLLVDDHQIVLDGLKSIIEDSDGINLIGTAQNGYEALQFMETNKPDVVMMDLDMPMMGGIEATQKILNIWPTTKIIILSMHDEKGIIKETMEVGACGYLIKNSSQFELQKAIKAVASGVKYFSTDVTVALLKEEEAAEDKKASSKIVDELTDREIEILKQIAEGYSNKEIGEKLFISHRTVDTHRTNLMKKLDIRNIAGLIKFAFQNNLVD